MRLHDCTYKARREMKRCFHKDKMKKPFENNKIIPDDDAAMLYNHNKKKCIK
jgi:hypothetical protein